MLRERVVKLICAWACGSGVAFDEQSVLTFMVGGTYSTRVADCTADAIGIWTGLHDGKELVVGKARQRSVSSGTCMRRCDVPIYSCIRGVPDDVQQGLGIRQPRRLKRIIPILP